MSSRWVCGGSLNHCYSFGLCAVGGRCNFSHVPASVARAFTRSVVGGLVIGLVRVWWPLPVEGQTPLDLGLHPLSREGITLGVLEVSTTLQEPIAPTVVELGRDL